MEEKEEEASARVLVLPVVLAVLPPTASSAPLRHLRAPPLLPPIVDRYYRPSQMPPVLPSPLPGHYRPRGGNLSISTRVVQEGQPVLPAERDSHLHVSLRPHRCLRFHRPGTTGSLPVLPMLRGCVPYRAHGPCNPHPTYPFVARLYIGPHLILVT